MRYIIIAVLALALGLSLPSKAGMESERKGRYSSSETVGSLSRDWLDLQRQGGQASTQPQALSPAVRDRIYQRYLDSFEYPIPENFYSRDQFREGN